VWRDVLHFCKHFLEPKRLERFIASYGAYAGLMFVMLQALQVIISPIPGEVTGFVGGLLFGNVLGTILSTIGLTLGSVIAFGIARVFGMPLVAKVVKKHYRDRFDNFVTHKGLYIAFILFVIPGFPKDSLCYLLGLTHMRLIPFVLMNIFGRLPGTLMLTLQGTAVNHKNYTMFFILLGVSLLMTLVLYLARDPFTKVFTAFAHRVRGKKRKRNPGRDKDRGKKSSGPSNIV
jgi:uncharacterized membrane protein YdjX (TVP38/TMEM64 family)